jgi:hypothetical protein
MGPVALPTMTSGVRSPTPSQRWRRQHRWLGCMSGVWHLQQLGPGSCLCNDMACLASFLGAWLEVVADYQCLQPLIPSERCPAAHAACCSEEAACHSVAKRAVHRLSSAMVASSVEQR